MSPAEVITRAVYETNPAQRPSRACRSVWVDVPWEEAKERAPDSHRRAHAKAAAILAALDAAGLAVVPTEPTREMLRAEDIAIPTPEEDEADPVYSWARATPAGRAMLAAAKESE